MVSDKPRTASEHGIEVRSAHLCRERKDGAALSCGVPKVGQPPALKQGFARRLLHELRANTDPRPANLWDTPIEEGHVWQRRFYDFVVFTEKKRIEKLRYMHRNPVKRGLVLEPQQWAWSSFRHYADGERGPVLVNEPQEAGLQVRKIA